MPFVERNNGIVCGCYAQIQEGVPEEWLPEDHAEVVAFLNPSAATPDQLEAACKDYLNDGGNIDLRKFLKAKVISDLAFRLGKAPGALTAAELLAERDRLAATYKTL